VSDTVSTIIVGAGSGGAALAARLTEDQSQDVILIEAGPDFVAYGDVPEPVKFAHAMSVDDYDWGLGAYLTEPPEARGEQPYPRGRLVGGSSSVNGAIGVRATVADLQSWVDAGNPRWSFEHVLPYYRKLENDLDFGEAPEHGTDGPVPIRRYAPEEWSTGSQAFVKSCLERDYGAMDDWNAPDATGVGPLPRNLVGEDRASSLLTYLVEARERPNLTILANTTCRRVLFEDRRAVGVEIERDGEIAQLSADRIVLAAGAIHTPQILMLSGVGPQVTLDGLGIPIVAAVEGVGQSFQDHPYAPIVSLLADPSDVEGVRVGLRYTSTRGRELGLIDDVMILPSELDPASMNLDVDTDGLKAITLVAMLTRPVSRGWLTIRSTDPKQQPELHANFLYEAVDVERLMECFREAWAISQSQTYSGLIARVLFPDAETVDDDAQLERYLRDIAATGYHASCTCKMGGPSDPLAVVDEDLAVRGVDNLWISDASVMVNVPTGFTNLLTYAIGERLAEAFLGQTSDDLAGSNRGAL
jgi:choline dehydrogenase